MYNQLIKVSNLSERAYSRHIFIDHEHKEALSTCGYSLLVNRKDYAVLGGIAKLQGTDTLKYDKEQDTLIPGDDVSMQYGVVKHLDNLNERIKYRITIPKILRSVYKKEKNNTFRIRLGDNPDICIGDGEGLKLDFKFFQVLEGDTFDFYIKDNKSSVFIFPEGSDPKTAEWYYIVMPIRNETFTSGVKRI